MRPDVEVVPAADIDAQALHDHVVDAWGAESVVGHGERIYPAHLPGFVALAGKRIAGHATYRVDGERCEVTSIEAEPTGIGIGSLLMKEVLEAARAAGCRTVWLTTTNDNLDALRFYQRRGFRLAALRAGAVDEARRTLKPELPETGSNGIPMRDELDLELSLGEGR
jgi:ribosomal protein S18 acetylase RimI-like enzyme